MGRLDLGQALFFVGLRFFLPVGLLVPEHHLTGAASGASTGLSLGGQPRPTRAHKAIRSRGSGGGLPASHRRTLLAATPKASATSACVSSASVRTRAKVSALWSGVTLGPLDRRPGALSDAGPGLPAAGCHPGGRAPPPQEAGGGG